MPRYDYEKKAAPPIKMPKPVDFQKLVKKMNALISTYEIARLAETNQSTVYRIGVGIAIYPMHPLGERLITVFKDVFPDKPIPTSAKLKDVSLRLKRNAKKPKAGTAKKAGK